MHAELIMLVCKKFDVSEAIVFRCAYDYAEIRIPTNIMFWRFLDCCEVNHRWELKVVSLPEFVEDFCIDVLANRVKLPDEAEILNYAIKSFVKDPR
jgi:hypothetical protein